MTIATTKINSLADLRGFPKERPPWHAEIVQNEMNGGTTTETSLAILGERPEITALTVSGLGQKSFEYLASRFGGQLTALHLWKCPRIEDFTPLESMPNLTHLAMFWNQRALRFWNLRKTPALRGLRFNDFIKINDLDDLSDGISLKELEFGNANWSKMVVRSLEPLSSLASLKSLSFNPKEITDRRIQPLANLQLIEDLSFSSRLFTTEQIAWLRAKLFVVLPTESLEPFRTLRQPILMRGKRVDVLVNGKGKPFLSTDVDKAKLDRYVSQFAKLVENFKNNPAMEPQLT